ncbi:MAG: ABC transporter ATP-binding protein [Rubrivivax sp. SCN 70-15]|nr:MAG: ABC transporter ATP-binding protein [Rubrivivax sp. SCN 70-15]
MTSVLEVRDLCASRGGKPVLTDVSLRLESGRIAAVLGPNGAGKSSLVLAMSGVLPLDAGEVLVDGVALGRAAPHEVRRAGIAAIPEGHQVLTGLSVRDNLRVAGCVLAPGEVGAAIERTLQVFPELRELQPRDAGTLSGGQRQMVALAQALMSRPRFILVDEMSLGLAPLIVARLMKVLQTLAAEGCGVLLIEQFTHVALQLADHAYVMNRGRIHFEGAPAEIEANPQLLHAAYLAG